VLDISCCCFQEGLLRVGEIIQVRAKDLRFVDLQGIVTLVIAIPDAKNCRAMGLAQFVAIRDAAVVAWAGWLTDDM
jgi:hypothetical protein